MKIPFCRRYANKQEIGDIFQDCVSSTDLAEEKKIEFDNKEAMVAKLFQFFLS